MAARRLFEGVLRRTNPLETFPRLGRVVPEYGDELRRELIHPPYRILYDLSPAERKILIVAVVHSARLLVQ